MAAWVETMAWMLTCSLAFTGLGSWVTGHLEGPEAMHPARAFWWGVLTAIPLAAAWHLVLPLDERAAMVFAIVGAVGWARHGRQLGAGFRSAARASPSAVVAWLLLWAALPYVSLQRVTCVDSALYYLASVEWHRAYAYVPGLQATNPLSVMNSGYFLLVSLIGTGPFAHDGHHVANAMFAWCGLPLAVAAVEQLFRHWAPGTAFVALAAAPGIDALSSDRMSCPSADIGVLWLGVAATWVTLSTRQVRAALLFALVMPLLKFSLIPLTVLLVALSAWRLRAQLAARSLAAVALLVAAVWLPLLAGNVVVSGYPLYPTPALRLPLDWALPEPLVRRVAGVIRSYASHDGLVGPNTPSSIASRLLLMNRAVLLPVVLALGGALLGVALHYRRWRAWSPLLLAAAASWLIWFVLAPDPRFAGVVLWLGGAAGSCAALGLPREPGTAAPDFASRLGIGALVIVLLLGDVPFGTWPAHVPLQRPERTRNTDEELVSLVDGTRIIDCTPGKAGCLSVPCAALYPEGLRLRVSGDVARGFVVPPDAALPPLTME